SACSRSSSCRTWRAWSANCGAWCGRAGSSRSPPGVRAFSSPPIRVGRRRSSGNGRTYTAHSTPGIALPTSKRFDICSTMAASAIASGGGRWFSVAARGRRLVDDRTRFPAALGNRSNGTAYRGADQNGQCQLADRKQDLPSGNERNLRDWAQALLVLRSRAERHSHRQQDNPTYHEHDCPKQIEIDPAAAQEAKVDPFVDDDRNKP